MRVRPQPNGGVYILRDAETGEVVRVGQTKNLARRQGEHRRDPALDRYDFKVLYKSDSYLVRRGLEQLVHDQFVPRLDFQEPISPRSPRRKKYLAAARRFLQV